MTLPEDYQALLNLSQNDLQNLCDELVECPIDSTTIESWLSDCATLAALFQECMARFDVATHVNTADQAAQKRLQSYRENQWPLAMRFHQRLNQHMNEHHDLLPADLQAAQARHAAGNRLNQSDQAVDLLKREAEIIQQYNTIISTQTANWQGNQIPPRQLQKVLRHADRDQREAAWRAISAARSADKATLNPLWSDLLDVRLKLAKANGFDSYLDYSWAALGRSDYTPQYTSTLHQSLLTHWTPLFKRLMARRTEQLQIERIYPWDIEAPLYEQAIQPFSDTDDLLSKTVTLFDRLDKEFGDYVKHLRDMGFIDLAQRHNTLQVGGFSRAIGRHGNFIFLNIHGTDEDVVNIIHELGHAISIHASCKLPYMDFWGFPYDFSEVPSSVMEMLSVAHWDIFYSPDTLADVEKRYFAALLFYSLRDAVNDALQNWIYRDPDAAIDPDKCSAHQHQLMQKFFDGIDWSDYGGDDWMGRSVTMPFHNLEYVYGRVVGLNLMALPTDMALERYKEAIALGNSTTIKALFAALGLDFPLTEDIIRQSADVLAERLNLV